MTKKFTIVLENETFVSNEEGFLDLNDIWRRLQLGVTRRPKYWNNVFKKDHRQEKIEQERLSELEISKKERFEALARRRQERMGK